jgi:hypothetical protein
MNLFLQIYNWNYFKWQQQATSVQSEHSVKEVGRKDEHIFQESL